MRRGIVIVGLMLVGCGGAVEAAPLDDAGPVDSGHDARELGRRREAGPTLPDGVDPTLQDRINEGFCYCRDAGLLCGGHPADAGAVNDCWYCQVGCR